MGVAQYFTHARGGQKVVVTCPGVVDALAEPHDLDLTHGTCELVIHQLGDGVARLDGCAAEPLGQAVRVAATSIHGCGGDGCAFPGLQHDGG